MAEKKKLGRGLDALLSPGGNQSIATLLGEPPGAAPQADGAAPGGEGTLRHIAIAAIQRGRYQPRRAMDDSALAELAASIKAQGVMQPIVVRPISSAKYEIIAGERRWRACQRAGLATVPCLVRDVDDQATIALSIIENVQREDLNPIEEALALKRLQDEFELTQQQVADAVGKSRVTVTNLLRLIGLNPEVRTLLETGKLEMGHARALLGLSGDEQTHAAKQVVEGELTVRQTETLVRQLRGGGDGNGNETTTAAVPPPHRPAATDTDTRKLEESLSERLGAKVSIRHRNDGKGELTIGYNSPDELEGILAHIK